MNIMEMKGPVTFIAYMTKEELITFVTEVHNFKMRTEDGRTLTSKRSYIKPFGPSRFKASNIRIDSLDCLDVLLDGEGYVRYKGDLGYGDNKELYYMLKHYGFEVEL